MNVILFGSTGMVGQDVLRECLLDAGAERVLCVGRSALGQQHPKLRECLQADLFDLAPFENQLRGYDACFFCLGVSSFGMTEEAYRRVTYDLTLSVAKTLVRLNPGNDLHQCFRRQHRQVGAGQQHVGARQRRH